MLLHKLREAMARGMADATLGDIVEMDGAYFGGYIHPENRKEDRRDRRLAKNQTGKSQCVFIFRERSDRSLPFVVRQEGDAIAYVRDHVDTHATLHADEAVWREDSRRTDNGSQASMVVGAAMDATVSRQWKGYWLREA